MPSDDAQHDPPDDLPESDLPESDLAESDLAESDLPEDAGEGYEEGDVSLDDLSDSFAQLIGHPPPPRQAARRELPSESQSSGTPLATSGSESGQLPRAEPSAEEAAGAAHAAAEVPITPVSLLEAILFVGHPSNEPVTSQRVAELIRGVEPQEVDGLVDQLNDIYAREARPYEIISEGAGFRLTLRNEFTPLRDKFYGKIREARLSQAAIDVLSIVAYEQPVTRKQVESICQRPVGGLLNQLVRRQLLRIERPLEKPREPYFLTTDRFLDIFGLTSLDDLPRSQSLDRDL